MHGATNIKFIFSFIYFYSFSILSSTHWALPSKVIKVSFISILTWAGYVACVSKRRIAQRVLVEKPEGKRQTAWKTLV
jgi:hypothetical protein